ncbi:MAG: hypothetical protein JJU45_13815, partial [Acidimicrobiia bacterium]|nr:hypothetical protein [Acidimicrobiia bacterium]
CDELGEVVETHLGEEVVEARRSFGGGVTIGGVVNSTETCTVRTDGVSYRFGEYVAADVGDGTTTDPLAVWEALEAEVAAAEDAGAAADERTGHITERVETAGATVDGVLVDDDDILLLVNDTTYHLSLGGFGVDPTAGDLEALVDIAVAVAQATPIGVNGLCDAVVDAVDDVFGGHEGDPRTGFGGGQTDGIEFETQTCRVELADSDLEVRASISDERRWEAATSRPAGSGPGGFGSRAEPVGGVGDGAFISRNDLIVRVDNHVIAVSGHTRNGERESIPPEDLVELTAAVLAE